MKPEDIHLWDWQRMLIGDVPTMFLLEVVLRVFFVYAILMVSMRFLGKRMSAQLTRNELAAMVSLAAAIGVPILAPDRGILPPIVIAIVVVSISRTIALVSAKNQRVESITQGTLDTLVQDGVLNMKTMNRTRITKERIFAHLRSVKVKQLGQVKRLYIEANGSFTIIRNEEPAPGLPTLPEFDYDFLRELKPNGMLVCKECGQHNKEKNKKAECPNCHHIDWMVAVESQ